MILFLVEWPTSIFKQATSVQFYVEKSISLSRPSCMRIVCIWYLIQVIRFFIPITTFTTDCVYFLRQCNLLRCTVFKYGISKCVSTYIHYIIFLSNYVFQVRLDLSCNSPVNQLVVFIKCTSSTDDWTTASGRIYPYRAHIKRLSHADMRQQTIAIALVLCIELYFCPRSSALWRI